MNKLDREIDRVLLDVILLDGEQDEAPSLEDMARRSKAILAKRDEDRRRRGPSKVVSVGRMKPSREQYREQTAKLREEVIALADGCCERCGWPTPAALGHMHHTRGGSGRRRQEQNIENVAWICGGCHDHLHRNNTDAREFREEIAAKRAQHPEARKAAAT